MNSLIITYIKKKSYKIIVIGFQFKCFVDTYTPEISDDFKIVKVLKSLTNTDFG